MRSPQKALKWRNTYFALTGLKDNTLVSSNTQRFTLG